MAKESMKAREVKRAKLVAKYAWDQSVRCHLTELNSRNSELTNITFRTSSQFATVVHPNRIRILWQLLQLLCSFKSKLVIIV